VSAERATATESFVKATRRELEGCARVEPHGLAVGEVHVDQVAHPAGGRACSVSALRLALPRSAALRPTPSVAARAAGLGRRGGQPAQRLAAGHLHRWRARAVQRGGPQHTQRRGAAPGRHGKHAAAVPRSGGRARA